jgi:hypothetical protein
MATKASNGARREAQRTPSASLTRLTMIDALRTWVVPALTLPAAMIIYILYNLDLIDRVASVSATGVLALATVLWAGLRGFISERTSGRLTLLLIGYAAIWGVGTIIPFEAVIEPGALLLSRQLRPHESVPLPIEGHPGRYRLIVEGTFAANQTHGNRFAHYRLALAAGDAPTRLLEGDFSEEFVQQRLGRRGTTTVRDLHTAEVHDFSVADPGGLRLSVNDISPPDAISTISVELYRQRISPAILVGIGLLLIAGAVVIDAWRPRDQAEGLLTTLTLGTLVTITTLGSWGGPHPGIGQLAIQSLLGAIAGGLAAMVLGPLTRPLVRRLPAAP